MGYDLTFLFLLLLVMPHIITNASERQAHPLYPNKRSNHNSMSAKARAESQEKTTAIPKTYDAIKSAAGADMKAKGRKC
jgi:hypothetical protein